jgi:hypothetical protein
MKLIFCLECSDAVKTMAAMLRYLALASRLAWQARTYMKGSSRCWPT